MNGLKNIKKIKGDASSRKFFRKKENGSTSIIIFSRKEKFKNLLIYDAVNKILIKNNILAPSLYKQNYEKNYLEIQDFGKKTLHDVLIRKKKRFSYFKKIVEVLNRIQLIKNKNIQNFKKKKFNLKIYNESILINEACLFCDWYMKNKLSKKETIKFTRDFKKIVKKLILQLKLKNNTFVHRDFHVSNLMLVDKEIGVIDSQDAIIGNEAYDFASLVDDVRLKTSKELKDKIYNFYVYKKNELEKKKFKNDFEILSVLRNLKIIGIFTRLAIRDKKRNYLRLIPHAWELIEMRIKNNDKFYELRNLIKKIKKKLNEN